MSSTRLFNPFPGLRPFNADEDYLFFGREQQTAELLTLLRLHRFLAVVGSSGSGKSSLVRAGLIPELQGGTINEAGSRWQIALLRPGGNPILNLARSLCDANLYDSDAADIEAHLVATLTHSGLGLVEAVRQAGMDTGVNMLVVVDQFEEVFRFRQTSTANEDAAEAFVNLLLEASQQKDVPIYVILTMRSDYIGDCAEFRGLAEAVNEGEYLIPRLGRDQLRRAIEGPVMVGGGKIANRLVQELLNDVGNNQDQLPVLQHALMRTWDSWESQRAESEPLDLSHYESVGGMEAALSRHADEIYAELPDDRHREVAEKVFKALTERGPDNRGIRRPTRLERLCAIVDGTAEEVTAVLDAFRRQRRTFLMPMQTVKLTQQTVIDISHESLMRVWRRLSRWVEEESQSARVYCRLAETAALHSEGKAGVYHDPDLQIALSWRDTVRPNRDWADRYHGGFDHAMEFLDASSAAKQVEEEAREAARCRELEQAKKLAETEQRAARRLRGLVAGVAVVAVVAVVASVMAMAARRDAQRSAMEAERQRENASRNAAEATLQAELASQNARAAKEEAVRADREAAVAARQAKLAEQARQQARRSLYYANINIAQRAIETTGDMGRAQELLAPWRHVGDEVDFRGWEWYYLDSLEQGAAHILHSDAAVWSAKYSPDGTWLASAGRTIGLWDVKTGRNVISFRRHITSSLVYVVDWSPDGKRLASAESDNTVKIWDIQTGRLIQTIRGHSRFVTCVAWHPDGSKVASTSGDGTAMIFDAQSGERMHTLGGHVEVAAYVAWSPDGNRLVTSDDGGWGRIWDAKTADQLHSRRVSEDTVFGAAWSPDGKKIAFSGGDTTVQVWDAKLEQLQSTLSGHSNIVWCVAWNPEGTQLVSGSFDQSVKVWDVASGEAIKTLRGHSRPVYGVCFGPDGRYVASASRDNTVRVWDTATEPGTLTLEGHRGRVRAVSWSPDASRLASVSVDGTLRIWDDSGRQIREIAASAHERGIETICWSPDGERIATAGYERAVKVWDAAGGQLLLSMDLPGGPATSPRGEQIVSVAWSPDGRYLASAGQAISIWNADTGEHVREWSGDGRQNRSVAWSPDGTRLASGGLDGSVRVWDWRTGDEVATLAGNEAEIIYPVAWSPDGTRLASGGGGRGTGAFGGQTFGLVRIWSTQTWQEVQNLRGHEQLVWSVAFNHDGTRLISASLDATARVWDVERGLEMLTLNARQGLRTAAWSPDGTRLATAGLDTVIKVWDATPGYRRERSPLLLTRLDDRMQQGTATPDDMQLHGQIYARLGRWQEAAADFERAAELLGPDAPGWFETDAWVVGPYPDTLSAEYPPEESMDPLQSVASIVADGENAVNEFRWKVCESPLDAGLNLGVHFDHSEHISGYVLQRVYAPAAHEAGVLLGSDDDARLWVNGDLVYEFEGGRTATRDDDSVAVVLRQGWNTILAKVVNRTGTHGLCLRLADNPLTLARVYEESGRWDKALELWSRLVEENPDNAQLRFARARVYVRLGQQEMAAEDFAHVTQRRPDDAPALFAELADRDVEAGELSGAIEWLTEALALSPNDTALLVERGELNGRLGRWQAGAADLSRVMELDPDDHWHAYHLGSFLVQLGDTDAYRRYCRELLDRFQDTQVVYEAERTGKICLLVPDLNPAILERAAKLIDHAIESGRNTGLYPWFQLSKGMAEYRLGHLAEAAEWLQKPGSNATASSYCRSAAFYFLAMAQHKLGQTQEAIQSLENAAQIVEQDLPTLENGDLGESWPDWLITHIARREAEQLIVSADVSQSVPADSSK